MPLTIPDDILSSAGLNEIEARIEIACRLFESQRLTLWNASKWLNMTRVQFEAELLKRHIPLCSPTSEDLSADLEAMKQIVT